MMGTAEVANGLPHPRLRPIVRQYVGYSMTGFPPSLHRGLPSRYLTFLVSTGRPVETLRSPGVSTPPPPRQSARCPGIRGDDLLPSVGYRH